MKSRWTKIRQWGHSAKQGLYYSTKIKKRGPTRRNRQDMALASAVQMTAQLSARIIHKNGKYEALGVISERLVTDAFINLLVDELQASTGGIANFSYHGSGIGSAVESGTDTVLGSEVDTRTNGTQGEGATQNIYKSVGTVNYAASFAIVEHGLFNASTGGTLMDRSVFGAINVADGDAIEFSYELTITGS